MAKHETKSVTVTARLSPSVAKRLDTCAKLCKRTRSFLIEYMVDRYIDGQIAEAEAILEGDREIEAGLGIPNDEFWRQFDEYVAERKRQKRKAA
jgi:predicted transcriptional regulator